MGGSKHIEYNYEIRKIIKTDKGRTVDILEQLGQAEEKAKTKTETEKNASLTAFKNRLVELTAAFEYLSPLGKKCFVVSLHEDPSHYPCPAVHLKKQNYSTIEIFISNDGVYHVGTCNQHKNTGINKQNLIELGDYVSSYICK